MCNSPRVARPRAQSFRFGFVTVQFTALGARDPRFDEYPAARAEAQAARRGVWQGAHQHPADWRAANPRQPRRSGSRGSTARNEVAGR